MIVSIVTFLLATAFASQPARASGLDTTAPTLVSLAYPSAFDVTTSAQNLVLSTRITDNASGVTSAGAGIYSQSGATRSCVMNLAAGSVLDGTWQCSISFPSGWNLADTWQAGLLSASDVAGNSVRYADGTHFAGGVPFRAGFLPGPIKEIDSTTGFTSVGAASGMFTIDAPVGSSIKGVSNVAATTSGLPLGALVLTGAATYDVSGLSIGALIDVVVHLPLGSDPTNIYKLVNGSYEDVTSLATISGDTVTLHLTDGGEGDEDRVANGVIVDPLVPVRFGAAGVPGPPSVTSVTAGVGKVNVAYAPPASAGSSSIAGYRATCISSDGGVAKSSLFGLANPLVVGTLSAGHTYTCTVVAKNAAGTSNASTPSGPVLLPTVPKPPTVTSATPGLHKIQVAYTPPTSNGGSPITAYRGTCTSSDGGVARYSSLSLVNPLIVGSLSPGHTYSCTLVAKNAVGSSSASTPSANVWVPTVPGPPTVTVATPGFERINVAYTPPTSNGGSPIIGYKATCTSSDGGVARSSTLGVANPLVVASLSTGHSYTCTVLAKNAVGTGAASAVSNAVVVSTNTCDGVAQTVVGAGTASANSSTARSLASGTAGFGQPVMAIPSGYSASSVIMDDTFQGTTLNSSIWSDVMGGPVPDVGPWGSYTGSPVVSNGLTLTNNGTSKSMVDTANPATGKDLFSFPSSGFYLQVNFKVTDMSNGFFPAIWFPYDNGIHANANEMDMFEGGFLPSSYGLSGHPINSMVESNYGGCSSQDSQWEQKVVDAGEDITQNFVTVGMEWVPGGHVNYYVGQGANRKLVLSDTNASNIGAFSNYNLVMTPQGTPGSSSGWHTQGAGTGSMYVAEVQVYSLP